MSVGTIQIPVLFDMSGSSVVYGEDATGADFVDSHLQFLLDMTTEANGISLNASDISSAILVADQDTGDNIFFDGDSKGIGIDNLCNRIAKAITRGKLVHVPSIGNYSNSGIPVGGEKYLYNNLGQIQDPGTYTLKYKSSIAPIGDEQMLGQAMARVASVHLIGDPLGSQAFEDATSIQTDLETASSHTFNQGQTNFYNALAVQLSKVLGGSKSSAPVNPGIAVGSEKYSSDYNLTSRDQTYNEDGRTSGSILPGQVYTSSSVQSTSYPVKYAFDTRYDTHWRSATDKFNTTTGEYEGSQPITGITGLVQNNNSWDGVWIKVDIGQTVVLSEYKIHPRRNGATVKNTPKEGYLISSIDGINWNEIHHLNLDDTTGRLLYYDSGTFGSADTDLTGLNNREGRYFAFVWKKVFTNSDQSYGSIGELQLLGVTKAEFDGGSPPTPYDVASSNSTLNGQVYSSSHYYDGSWKSHEAFDNQFSDSSAWLTPSGTFDKPTGELTSSYTSTSLSSGLTGEWIQVDLSQNINPGKFYLSSVEKGRPGEGYLLSSKDGNNWDIVHTLDSNIWNSHSTDRYHYLVDISGTPTGADDIKIGNHWRLAITKMVPTNDGEIYLYDFNLHGIVYPDDFGSTPTLTNEIYIFNRTAYDFTSFDHNVSDTYFGTDISNQRYSASSYWDSSYRPNYAFRDSMDAYWRSSNYLRYNTTTGLHNFSTWTGPYRGEYVQVDLSENFVVSSYVVEGHRTTNNDRYNSPKKGYLLGSIDNKKWNLIHTFDLSSNDASEFYTAEDGYKTIVNHTDKTYNCTGRYFRFVIEKLFPGCDGYASLYNLRLLGVKESEASLGNGESTTTFVNDYTALASPENLTRHAVGNSTYLAQNAPEPFPQSRFTASSYESNSYHPKLAFSQLSGDTAGWRSKGSLYNTSTGTYYGTNLTDIYKGEWIQIDLSSNIFVDSYNLAGWYDGNQSYHNSSPKKGYLLSSLDGKDWRLAHTFDYAGDHADYTIDPSNNRSVSNNKITNNENAIGRYWRFVVEKLFPGCQNYAAIMNLALIGVRHPSQTIQGEVTKTTQDNTIYTLDVTPYVLTNYSITDYAPGSTLTGHEYSSSSYQSGSYTPERAFRSYYNNYWRSYGQKYNTTNGEYYGPYITNGYKGEWIQVDLSENVFADSYSVSGWLSTTQSYHNSSPKKGYLLSSLDGDLWRLAHTFDIAGDHADYTYNATDKYGIINHKITNNKNAIGRYWRFVVEKLFPDCQNYAAIYQFVIYGGKETELTIGDGASNKQLKLYSTPTTATDFTNGWQLGSYTLEQVPMNHMNQTFTASSWQDTNYLPKEAFGRYTSTANYWRSYGTEYNATSGTYFGSKRTGDYPGEWIQVDLSENYFANNYAISGYLDTTDSYHNSSPKKGYLLSSLDGKDWRLAHTFDISGDQADYVYNATDGYGYVTHDISNNSNAIGRYWRFVTEKIFPGNNGHVSMSKFSINGAKQTDIIEGNVVVDNSRNNVIYKLNATPYDLFNNFSELTGQVYSASSHGTTSGNNQISNTFDGFIDTYKWYSLSQYNGGSGLYYGSKFTGPYHGEWIQVDLSENVFAGSYVISGYKHATDSYHNSSPKKGYLLSSLDGKDWRLAHTFDVDGDEADYVYNATDGYGYVTHDISNNSNAVGRYWRFVTEKVFPSNGGYVWIGQFTVLGVKYPSEVTVDSGALTTTFTNKIRTTVTPYDLFNNFSELTGQVYSASSHGTTDGNYQISNTFDGFQDEYKWYSKSQYNGGSGLYYGSKFTGPYHGEWIQVDLSENVFAGSYVISGRFHATDSYHNSSPKKGYLLSSLDGKDWRLAHTFDISGDHADYVYNATDGYGYVTHDISNNSNAVGRYWRFVTEKIFPGNGGSVWIGQFTVLGVKYPSETIEGELVIDVSNNNPGYTLNATPYDLFNNFSELTGQVYSASSHGTTDGNYQITNTFDGFIDGYKWYSKSQYNSGSGVYYGTKFTGPYHGEWIQVDLSENVFAGSYVISGRFHATDSYHNSSPKKGYLLSSLDGKDWRLAHIFDVDGDEADYVYNTDDGYGFIQHDISNNENAIGRYWRFVTEKIFPGNGGSVWISQFTVLGVKYPSEVTVSNLAIDPSLNISNVLPADMATIYDLVSSNSTLTGQVYSGSNLDSNYPPSEAFDGILNDWESHWKGASQYNSSSGTYYGTRFTGPYPGEWLQVDLSENVIIGEYEIYPPYHSSYYIRAPKKSYLLSSLDGEKWNLVHTHDVNTFSDSYGTYQGKVSYKLSGDNCKGRYFRLVTEKVFNTTLLGIAQLIIKGIRETETYITSQSLANSYNTFTNKTTPYKIYTRALRHTTDPYVISSEKTTLNSVDVVSTASAITNQTYTATYGTAANAFDNSGNTEWSTDASSNYGIISSLITNEPNFVSWEHTADGVIVTFSENLTVNIIDKSKFSLYDTSENAVVNVDDADVSGGKLIVVPFSGFIRDESFANPYDLTSTASVISWDRANITYSSQHTGGYEWDHCFDNTTGDPFGITAHNTYGTDGYPTNVNNTVVSGVTYNGEWVQIDLEQQVFVQIFEYVPRGSYPGGEWDTLLLAGSNDGVTWNLMWRESGRASTNSQTLESYNINYIYAHRYFRWICEKNHGDNYAWGAREMTLKGHVLSEGSNANQFTTSKINQYRLTYSKPLNQDNQLKGVTNGVAVQSFVLEDGAVTGRGEFAILPLSLNEPTFTSSQVVSGKLEYTFSENLQAGAGGFDITDFQLIEPSGNVVDLSSNDTGIVNGKLVIGTYPVGFHLQGNNYALSGPNESHGGDVSYRWSTQFNTTGYRGDYFHDGNNSNRWSSAVTYSSGTYSGSVSTATSNAGNITGEYVEIDTGKMSILSHFTYFKSADSSQEITTGYVVGSKDNVTWDVITSFSYDVNNDPDEVTKNISTQAEYRYYRLIYSAVNGGNKASCNEWTLYGHIKDDYYIGETISDVNYLLIYSKNATVSKNIIGATNNVAINSFHIDNNLLVGRGGITNIGQYDGSTLTTLTDTSTYKGEYIQVDIGKNVIINNYGIDVKSLNENDNPKSWMLVGSLNNSDWTKLHEVFNYTLTENYVATVTSTKVRYLRLIVNRGGASKHIKISEFKVNGIEIKLEGQTYSASIDNGDANTVFDNSIATSWNTSSSYNYNGIDAPATNEATYSSIGLHTDASGNKKIELTFSADLSSNDIKYTDFSVVETDFSNTIPILADISGGKLLIEKQANIAGSVLYEDFNDQVIAGPYATATFEQGGILNGTTFEYPIGKALTIESGLNFNDNHTNNHTFTELNGKYYVSERSQTIQEINLTTLALSNVTDGGFFVSGYGNYGHLMFAYNGSLYLYGGSINQTQLDSYNPTTDTWTFNITTTGTAHPFYRGGYCVDGNTLYVVGGYHSSNISALDLTTMNWTTLNTTVGELKVVPTFVYNNRLYIYGGSTSMSGRSQHMHYLDLANPSNGITSFLLTQTLYDPNNLRVAQGSWFGGAPRGARGVAVKDGKMYYVGGYDEYYRYYPDVLHYIDLANGHIVNEIQPGAGWKSGTHYRHTHFFVGDELHLLWGGTESGTKGVVNVKNLLYKIDITKTAADFGYRLKGEYSDSNTVSTKIWRTPTVTHKAISFWHYYENYPNHSYNGYLWSSYFDNNDKTNSHIGLYLYQDELRWDIGSAAAGKMVRYYVDGVERTPASSIHPYYYNQMPEWHFIYFEFNDDLQFSHFLSRCIEDQNTYGAEGPIDQVRLYNTSVSEAHIKEMYAGWDGMYPGASFNKTDYLIEYQKNTDPKHNIYDVNNTSVPINSFIIRNGSLISRGTNYGHYSGSTITTLADNSTSTGEYIEVNMGQQTYIINYELHVPAPNVHPDNNVYPKSWTLLGSTDGSSWTKIHEVSDYTGWTTYSHYGSGFEGYKVSYLIEIKNMAAQYYRLIINKTYGKVGYTSVAELLINGVKHTSETTGVTQTKTASLGTAANAFDDSILTDWNTSATPSYSIIATAATNEPTFSSITVNSGKLELTFSDNLGVIDNLSTRDFKVTDISGTEIFITPSIVNNKLELEYLTIPSSQFFYESFDNENANLHADNDLLYVDGYGDGGKAISSVGRSINNYLQYVQQTSDGSLSKQVRAVSFYLYGKFDTTPHSYSIIFNNIATNTNQGLLRFTGRDNGSLEWYDGNSEDGAPSGSVYLPNSTQPKIYIDGELMYYNTNGYVVKSDNTVITMSYIDDNWRHFYVEFPETEKMDYFSWFTNADGHWPGFGYLDEVRYYDEPLLSANIQSLAGGGNGGLSGSFVDTNVNILYTKHSDISRNIVNAAHTTVPVSSFFISNSVEMSRGDTGKGDYRGTTSTTLPDSSTYDGEWVQIDIGQTILMTSISLVVPNKDAYSNPKSWKLLISQDNTNWVEALDVSGNTVWDSGFASASTDYTGFQIGENLTNPYIGRYFKVIVNSVIGPSNHVKINEVVIKGVSHTQETQSVAGDHPILYTATESSNTTSQTTSVTTTTHNTDDTTVTTVTETTVDISANTVTKTTTKETITTVVSGVSQPTVTASNNTTSTTDSTVTTTTHNADDTTITTVTETTIDIATNTVTTTTTKRTVTTLVSGITLNTATPSSVTTVDSDTTALTTTYNNNDTSVRTVVNKTVDISANTDTTTNLNTVITTTVSGFSISTQSGSSFIPNKVFDASGVAVPALKSIYEQLMNVPGRAQIMQSREFTSSPMPSAETITGGFPFIPGDKLVMYLRPKIVFAQATFPEQFTSLLEFTETVQLGAPAEDIALASGSGGGVTGQTYTASSQYNTSSYAVSKLFDNNAGSFWITANGTYSSLIASTGAVNHTFVLTSGGDTSTAADSQIYHEDFEDQSYDGTLTTAEVVSDGYNSSSYALSVPGTGGNAKRWVLSTAIVGGNFNNMRVISFWYNPNLASGGSVNNTILDFRTSSTNAQQGVQLDHSSTEGGSNFEKIYISGNQYEKVYINGVSVGTTDGSKIWTTSTYTSGQWYHILIELKSNHGLASAVLLNSGYVHDGRYHCAGKIDDVRIFNMPLSTSQIADLTAGGNGNDGKTYVSYNGHYAQIEFTESMAVEKIKLTPRNGGGGGGGEPMDFRLLTSDDIVTWTNLLTVNDGDLPTNWEKDGSAWATQEWNLDLTKAQGKYWRLVVNKISAGDKVQLGSMELIGGKTSELAGSTNGDAGNLNIPGLETNVTNVATTFTALFPGNTKGGSGAEATKFGWVGSANADTLSLETTDEKDTRTMDLHIWKITITL